MADDATRLSGWNVGHAGEDGFEITLELGSKPEKLQICIPYVKLDLLIGALKQMKDHGARLKPDLD